MEIYTAGRLARIAGSWSSGYDIALTQRRSPVRIRSSPSSSPASSRGPDRASRVSNRRSEGGDEDRDERKARERDQGEPPRLVSQMHVIGDDEGPFDRREDDEDEDRLKVRQAKAVRVLFRDGDHREHEEHHDVGALLQFLC